MVYLGYTEREEAHMPIEWDCRSECQKTPVVVGIGETTGYMYLFCAECFASCHQDDNIQWYGPPARCHEEKVSWHGTHILKPELREELGADGFYANGTDVQGYDRQGMTGK